MKDVASLGLDGCGMSKLVSSIPIGCSKLTDIEHVVILIQENRSFDTTLEATAASADFRIKA
jgi:hypothetical protein